MAGQYSQRNIRESHPRTSRVHRSMCIGRPIDRQLGKVCSLGNMKCLFERGLLAISSCLATDLQAVGLPAGVVVRVCMAPGVGMGQGVWANPIGSPYRPYHIVPFAKYSYIPFHLSPFRLIFAPHFIFLHLPTFSPYFP